MRASSFAGIIACALSAVPLMAQTPASIAMDGQNGGTGFYRDAARTKAQEEAFVAQKRTACERNDLKSCALLANVLLRPQHIQANRPKAIELYERACAGGVMTACGNLGMVLVRDETQRGGDRARGLALMQKGCDGGDPGSCTSLGGILVDAKETAEHRQEGLRLLRKTCETFALACHQLGAVYLLGGPDTKDVPTALAMYGRACDMGSAVSCGVLADLYGNGRILPRDLPRAFGYLTKACQLGSTPACSMLAASRKP